jgi:sugar lactone lactonase YvrE
MRRFQQKAKSWARPVLAGLCVLGLAATARAGDVTVPGSTDFPESVTASSDGTMFFSSITGSRVFRVGPGQAQASEWIKPGTNGLSSVLGLLADDRTNTLYVCSADMTGFGVKAQGGAQPSALKTFDLKTGAPKGSMNLPPPTVAGQPALCNDIAVGPDGTAYVSDTLSGRILRLKPGATTLEVWAHDPRWEVKGPQLDGIAVLGDGVYANIFEGDGLYRVAVNSDGSAGAITKLQTSRPIYHADGMRSSGPDRLLMVEGEKRGMLDLISVKDGMARIDTVKSGFQGPVAVTQVGDTAYVLDVPLKYLFESSMKSQTPPPFTAVAVPLSQ